MRINSLAINSLDVHEPWRDYAFYMKRPTGIPRIERELDTGRVLRDAVRIEEGQ